MENYPFGKEGQLELHCAARKMLSEKPQVKVESNVPVEVELRWQGGSETLSHGGKATAAN